MNERTDDFGDVFEEHWSSDYIANTYEQGWIGGYPDGSFKPETHLTRAEAVTIINRMLNRTPKAGKFSSAQIPYTDLDAGHWAWKDILEASLQELV